MKWTSSYNEPVVLKINKGNELLNNNQLSNINFEELANKIYEFVNSKKPHLNKHINLTLFSTLLEANYHTVSAVLNKIFKMNFFEFINYLRIEEAKQILSNLDKNHLKIEAVGYECGFNSKTAFYRAFKRFTGLTPIDYYQKVKNEISYNQ